MEISSLRQSISSLVSDIQTKGFFKAIYDAFKNLGSCFRAREPQSLQSRVTYEARISEQMIEDVNILQRFASEYSSSRSDALIESLDQLSESTSKKLEPFMKKYSPREAVSKFLDSYLPAIQVKCAQGKFDKGAIEHHKVGMLLRKIFKAYPHLTFWRSNPSSGNEIVNTAEKLLGEYDKKREYDEKVRVQRGRSLYTTPMTFASAAQILRGLS